MDTKTPAELAGSVMGNLFFDFEHDEKCFVLLTEELYDHLKKMYDNTNWEEIKDAFLDFPENDGEWDDSAFRKEIGNYIYFARWEDPVPDLMQYNAFEDGMVLRVLGNLFSLIGDQLEDFKHNYIIDFKSDMELAAMLALKSGMTEDSFLDSIRKEI